MKTKIIVFVLLFVFWLALSAKTNVLLLATGLVSAALVLFLSQRLVLIGLGFHTWSLYRRLPLYALRLLWNIVHSNIDVAARIVHPRLPIKPGFVRLPIRRKSPISQLIHANSITLTPGTITTGIDEQSIEVHALTYSDQLKQKLMLIDQQTSGWL